MIMSGSRPILSVLDLEVRDKASSKVLSKLEKMTVQRGEILGIYGPSGIGKSLFLKTLAGLTTGISGISSTGMLSYTFPTEDTVNIDLSNKKSVFLPAIKTSMITQEQYASLDMRSTVKGHLYPLLTSNGMDVSVKDLLSMVGLTPFENFENKYPFELSGGEAQRLSVACAIASKSEIILCDEPTSSLDTLQKKHFVRTVKALRDEYGMTFLIVSHDLSLLNGFCYRVVPYDSSPIMPDQLTTYKTKSKENSMDEVEQVLRLQNISYGYYDSDDSYLPALKNISLALKSGLIYGLTGPSGSGKTTLGKLLAGKLHIYDGQILLRETDVRSMSMKRYRSHLSRLKYIHQDNYESFNSALNIYDNLRSSALEYRKDDFRNRLCQLLDSLNIDRDWLDRKPLALSGGQRQKVNILRSLLTPTDILILDEPLTGVDYEERQIILQWLVDVFLSLNLTVVWISHDIKELTSVSDYIFVMQDGKIVEEGNRNKLTKNPDCSLTKALLEGAL